MAIGNGSGPGGLRADINVTPLIDVLLVLLIIFMVIVPATPHGLEAVMPQLSSPNQKSETAVVVQVLAGRNGQARYKINQEDVAIGDLGNRLNAIFSVRAEKVMFIQADAVLDFSAVAQVLDIGKGAGADHIGLMTPKRDTL